jgi:hypothetical protein
MLHHWRQTPSSRPCMVKSLVRHLFKRHLSTVRTVQSLEEWILCSRLERRWTDAALVGSKSLRRRLYGMAEEKHEVSRSPSRDLNTLCTKHTWPKGPVCDIGNVCKCTMDRAECEQKRTWFLKDKNQQHDLLCYITLYYIILYHIILCYVTLYYIISYHIISYIILYNISYYIIPYLTISYYIILYYISYHILYYIILYYITLLWVHRRVCGPSLT